MWRHMTIENGSIGEASLLLLAEERKKEKFLDCASRMINKRFKGLLFNDKNINYLILFKFHTLKRV